LPLFLPAVVIRVDSRLVVVERTEVVKLLLLLPLLFAHHVFLVLRQNPLLLLPLLLELDPLSLLLEFDLPVELFDGLSVSLLLEGLMLELPELRLFELVLSKGLLLEGPGAKLVLKGRLALLLFFQVRHQLGIMLNFCLLLLLLPVPLLVKLRFKLLLHPSLLFIALFTFLAQLLLVHLSLVVDDLGPLILREHGGAIDAQIYKLLSLVNLRILQGKNVS